MKRQVLIISAVSSFFTVALVAASLLIISGVLAAPAAEPFPATMQQSASTANRYLSISSMTFQPFSEETAPYRRNFEEQILALDTSSLEVENQNNWFIAPLLLPNDTLLTGITFFGRDLDPNGWIEIALWRCTHGGQVSCIDLPLSSYRTDESFTGGNFDSGRIALNEVINNQIYSYTLATRIMAVNGSGLRSVVVELSETSGSDGSSGTGGSSEPIAWTLDNRNVTTQLATGISPSAVVEICSDSRSSANIEVQYGSNVSTLTPGNCARYSGYSSYAVKNVGVYGSFASGTFEVFRN